MIDYITPTLQNKLKYYAKIDDLIGGAVKIKESGSKYLPEEDSETPESYTSRLQKATYFDFFNQTIDGLTGLIFKNPISYGDDIPSQLQPIIENADALGNHMDVIIDNFFTGALQKGVSFCLIDAPKVEGVKTRADEQKLGVRPYLTIIKAENVTSWKTEVVNGQLLLSQVKIREFVEVEDSENPYATKTVEQYRVLYRGGYQVFRKQEKSNEPLLVDEGTTNLDFIPLVCLNLGNEEFFSGMPPFMDLGELNIAHYQILSDSRYSAHIASVPVLKLLGFDKDELTKVTISVNKAIASSNTEASVEWLDYNGGGVAVNETLLSKIETKIREMALSVISQDKTLTATEVNISSAQSQSKLNGYVRALTDAVELIFQMAAKMYGLNDGGSITINSDILSQPLSAQEVLALNTMATSGNMSIETMFSIIQSGTFKLPSDFDVNVEKERVESAGLLTE